MTYRETDLVETIERLAGTNLAALTQSQREQFDQFHSGGAEAVDLILPSLHAAPGTTVLDVGSGFGGPARQIAGATGCHVIGVDVTPAYVEAARALTRAAGLDGQVEYVCADIAALDRFDFDAAYTVHVQMNVEDKKGFFSEIARRLRPGAHFATFEVCLTGSAQPTPPLPWSIDGTDSYLATADELCETIASSGFDVVQWVDETPWLVDWFTGMADRLASAASSAVLPALLSDGPTRVMNLAVAVNTGVVSIHRGSFIRRPLSS